MPGADVGLTPSTGARPRGKKKGRKKNHPAPSLCCVSIVPQSVIQKIVFVVGGGPKILPTPAIYDNFRICVCAKAYAFVCASVHMAHIHVLKRAECVYPSKEAALARIVMLFSSTSGLTISVRATKAAGICCTDAHAGSAVTRRVSSRACPSRRVCWCSNCLCSSCEASKSV